MLRNRSCAVQVAGTGLLLATFMAGSGARADVRMLRLRPCDGIGAFAKEFRVPIGTEIAGVRFANGDPGTVFPEIALVSGPVTADSPAPVRTARDAREADMPGTVTVLWSEAVVAAEDVYHVIVRMPRELDLDRAPRIGAVDADAPTGSYIVSRSGEAPIAMGADLGIELVTGVAGKTSGRAGMDELRGPDSSRRATLTVLAPRDARSVAALVLDIPKGEEVGAVLHDVRGRRVRTLIPRSFLPSGRHRFEWDGTNDASQQVARGIYIVRMTAGEERLTRKLVAR